MVEITSKYHTLFLKTRITIIIPVVPTSPTCILSSGFPTTVAYSISHFPACHCNDIWWGSRDSSVGIVTRLRIGQPKIIVFPTTTRDVSLLHNIHTGPVVHPNPLSVGSEGLLSRGCNGCRVKVTIPFHVLLTLRVGWVLLLPLPLPSVHGVCLYNVTCNSSLVKSKNFVASCYVVVNYLPYLISDGSTDEWRNMLNVNVLGLAVCTREALKSMKERNKDEGHVIHINR